ncbi:hypothetical protein FHEFKHOI_00891 [Candidatus Methanoperedenaceae archaeon GB50]|nr:hypothetical protein AIOGIFDO_00885 [Candidatus Methanoperedenaceae archaeon GB37]CAD7770814.1 hypothetical protein FHEFKHOI_00891 [Candidatus Methanoperedenaceae archaeon GB50]CAD7781182.1 MAG: hypothetical protein KBONHNOK_01595 [Candidatus Methanoperedenaceae archaeon GB50]
MGVVHVNNQAKVKNMKECEEKARKIVPLIVAAILFTSIFGGMASAERSVPIKKVEQVERERQITMERYREARQVYQDARMLQREAVQKYREIRATEKNPQVLLDAAKTYVEKTIDSMIARLEVLKEDAEEGYTLDQRVERIDAHITRLEELKDDVKNATTMRELQSTVKDIRREWRAMKNEARYFTSHRAIRHIEIFLAKADRISERIEAVIGELEDAGADVTDLREKLDRFNDEIDAAEEDYEKAKEIYEDRSGFDPSGQITDALESERSLREINSYLREANRHVRAASSILKEIFNEIRGYRDVVFLNGTGGLHAEGDGRAAIFGDVEIEVSVENGTIFVSSNADVTTDGEGTEVALEVARENFIRRWPGENAHQFFDVLPPRWIKYQGSGNATVKGEDICFWVSGSGIVLDATGTGKALLCGEGTYYTEKDDGTRRPWTTPVAGVAGIRRASNVTVTATETPSEEESGE